MKPRKLTIPQILFATSILGILTGFIGGVIYRDQNPGENQLQVKLEMMDKINVMVDQHMKAWAFCGRCHSNGE